MRSQAEETSMRRKEAETNLAAKQMLNQLKTEMAEVATDVWQGRASVELVHDLANPLTVMIGYAGLLQEEAKVLAGESHSKAAKFMEYAQIVERSAEYCHHLAENWRKSTHHAEDFKEVDLVELAREMHRVIFFSNDAIVFSGEPKECDWNSRGSFKTYFAMPSKREHEKLGSNFHDPMTGPT